MKVMGIPVIVLMMILVMGTGLDAAESVPDQTSKLEFEISYPASAHAGPITGRVFIMISRTNNREVRLQVGRTGIPLFGLDVEELMPGDVAVIDESTLGAPVDSLKDIPPGDYYIQGLISIYTHFHRADGHVVWIHNDQWEGQDFRTSPGNLVSEVLKVHLDRETGYAIEVDTKNVIPPIEVPPDTKWVKRIKFESKILSEFWGEPIFLGATVLLPKGYDENPGVYYPADYVQGHFSLNAPYRFRTDDPGENDPRGRQGYEFYQAWISDDFPRMILVTFQHPCPYFDDSYAVNSANCGPYGDALMTELIPRIEETFRIIRQPYARVVEGGSTGGWEAAALQIFHPDFFGGCFSYCPDPIDFRDVEAINIYEDKNAYYREYEWRKVVTPNRRNPDGSLVYTSKQKNTWELVRGTHGRGGEQSDAWQAVYGPVGEDGYTKPLFDKVTGEIDPTVARYWKEHYDLRYYLERNWATVGPKLVDKLYFFTGDMDSYYQNNAVHMMEEFLAQTENPHYKGFFWYAPRKPHCWTGPWDLAGRLKFIATHIATHTPSEVETSWWQY